MPCPTSIARLSRVKLSTTVSARMRRPSKSASETKSIDQHSFNCPGCGPGGPVRGHYVAPWAPKPELSGISCLSQ